MKGKHSIQIITSVDNINWSAPVIVDIERRNPLETATLYSCNYCGTIFDYCN
ncbi:MAG: hypothetical protein IPJ32_06980 [Sphingobacteriaceae bacterium]|nr:hypothetical protein [Sphingobacteriaceae bacterium]